MNNNLPPEGERSRRPERMAAGKRPTRPAYPRPRVEDSSVQRRPSGSVPRESGYRRGPETPIRRERPAGVPSAAPQGQRQRPARSTVNKRSTEDYLLWFLIVAVILLVATIITFIIINANKDKPSKPNDDGSTPAGPATPGNDWSIFPSDPKAFIPKTTDDTVAIPASLLNSEFAILVDLSSNNVIASRKADAKMYPASMTKVMTAIVACEHIEDMQDTFTITKEIRYPLDNAGASMAYFEMDKPIYMIDLIYGALLPSGADATAALAVAIAGSEDAFVELMNKKAEEIGCTSTHFMNTTGLHHDNHYSTARDIANIMAYALQNPFLKKVMCTASYKSSSPVENADNMLRATWLKTLNSMEGSYSFFEGAKTGYETEAGSCMVSLIKDGSGNEYVIVTAKAVWEEGESETGSQQAFLDLKTIYNSYVAQ